MTPTPAKSAGLVLVVSNRFHARFPCRQEENFESVERLLDDTPVHQLWLNQDIRSLYLPLDSLVDILCNEDQWEGRSNIDEIIIFGFSEEEPEVQELFQRLRATKYPVRFVAVTDELFIDTEEN